MANQKKASANIFAPVVCSYANADVQLLVDFALALKASNPVHAARAEAKRLRETGYFESLADMLSKSALQSDATPNPYACPKKIESLFNTAAACCYDTLLSVVAVVPSMIRQHPMMDRVYDKFSRSFNPDMYHNGLKFRFGFMQLYIPNNRGELHSSTTFPTLEVCSTLMGRIPRDKLFPLLQGLQHAFSFVNHDWLHHMSSAIISGQIGHENRVRRNLRDTLEIWWREMPDTARDTIAKYEGWAHFVQESVCAPRIEALAEKVSGYFDALDRAASFLAQAEPDAAKRFETIDYFGTLMCHALSRVIALDHPLLESAITRTIRAAPPLSLENEQIAIAPAAQRTLDLYTAAGRPLLPLNGDPLKLKKLDLVKISPADTFAHAPGAAGNMCIVGETMGMLQILDRASRPLKSALAAKA